MALFSALAVVGAIVAGLFVMGSPAEQRQERFDARRVMDLRQLSYSVTARWTQTQRLPAGTPELVDGQSMTRLPVDPVSKAPYEYRVTGQRQFELCATFDRTSPTHELGDFWAHEPGRKCFSFDVDAKVPR
jgi:hypothetical protein